MKINKILVIVLIIILVVITVGLYFVYKNKKNDTSESKLVEESSSVSKSSLDNDYKYIVITDLRYATMMNDGSSNTDLYYEIDLQNNTIEEISGDYDRSLSKTEKERLIEKYDLNQTYNDRLQKLFDSILKSTDTAEREELDKFKSYYLLNNGKEVIMTEEEKDEFVDIISELKNNQ